MPSQPVWGMKSELTGSPCKGMGSDSNFAFLGRYWVFESLEVSKGEKPGTYSFGIHISSLYYMYKKCISTQSGSKMKRTNIVLDEKLVEDALKATGLKTRRELVDYALRELLRRESQKRILKLKGAIHWEGNLSSMRRGRISQ